MKNKKLRTICSGLLSLTLFATSAVAGFADQGLGNVIYEESSYIAPGTVYAKKVAIQTNNSRQVAYTMSLDTRGGQIVPIVYEGIVTGGYTLSNKLTTLKNQGYNVIAGINGDFYTVSTGVPLGLTIHDGKIKTSGVNFSNCLAFRYDGTALMAAPNLGFSMTVNGATPAVIGMVNKMQGTSTSINFYNNQFAGTTKTTQNSVEVIVSATEGAEPFIGGTITGTVKAVRTKTKNTPLYTNEFVLSVNASAPDATYLSKLKEGDVIAVSVTDKNNNGWNQVKECIGAYQVIVKNGALSTTDKSINPRTCVGIKPDGSLFIYAVDGRQSGHSAGMNLVDVAQYMISQGCVTAVNFDGGGSTTVAAKMPWDQTASIVNKPSGGTQRAVTNSLIFVTNGQGSGVVENLHIKQLKTNILTRATTQFTATASDNLYHPVSMPQGFADFSVVEAAEAPAWVTNAPAVVSIGTMQPNGVFKAGETAMQGYVKATYEGKEIQAPVNVLGINEVKTSLKDVSASINISPGTQKDFTLSVTDKNGIPVIAQENLFTWVCDPALGTIDTNGLFKATTVAGVTGKISVYYPPALQESKEEAVSEAAISEGAVSEQEKASGSDTSEEAVPAETILDETVSEGAILQETEIPPVDMGKLIKQVQVTVGTAPVILADFESGIAGWSTGGLNMGKDPVAIKHQTFAMDPNTVFFGKGSLKIYYDMKTKGYKKGAAGAYAIKPLAIPGYPKKIGMWVNGDGKGHWLRSEIKDASGKTVLIDYTDDVTGVNWKGDFKYLEANVPAGLKAPLTLSIPVRYMEKVESKKSNGIIYIDNIRAIYDFVNDDKTAPTTEGPNFEPGSELNSKSEFTVQIVDDPQGSGMNWDRVRIYLDGKEITKGVVKNADHDNVLRWNLVDSDPVSEGTHTIWIIAKDHFQNMLQVKWDYQFVK